MNLNRTQLKQVFATSLLLVGVVGSVVFSGSVKTVYAATSLTDQAQCQGGVNACVCPSGATTPDCIDPAATNKPTIDCDNNGSFDAGCTIFSKYLNPFIKLLSFMTGIAVVAGITIGGIQYSASGGDPQKAAKAKTHIRNSIIALITFFFLYAFLKFLIPGGSLTTG